MHFRHLLITGLIVGAAIFLPDNVLAEKNDLNGPMNAPGTAQQVVPSVERDHTDGNPVVPDKGKPANVPAPAINNQNVAQQQPALNSANTPAAGSQMPVETPQKPAVTPEKPVAASQQSTAAQGKSPAASQNNAAMPGKSAVALQKSAAAQGKSDVASQRSATAQGKSDVALQKATVAQGKSAVALQKSVAASRNLPYQAKGNVQPYLNKSENSIHARASEKLISAQEEKNGLDKNFPALFKEEEISAFKSLHIAEKDGNTRFQWLWSAPQGEVTAFSENNAVQPVQLPYQEGDIPTGKEEIPMASQSPNPTQRTNNHGGPSNDRMNPGISGLSFPDKWLAWKPYYEIQLVQSYQSRQIRLNNQWVNAPPSPPPQEAPLLETITRS